MVLYKSKDNVHSGCAFYTSETCSVCGVKGAKGCASFTDAHLWPYKFILHLLAIAVIKGLDLQTYTPVSQVSSASGSDGIRLVSMPRGTIKAKKVTCPSNGFTAGMLPQYSDRIVSCGILCRIVTADPKKAPHLTNSYVLGQGGRIYDYVIPRADGSIIIDGARPRC